MLQEDSAHQIGLKPIFHTFLIAGCCFKSKVVKKLLAGLFCPQTLPAGDVLANLTTTSRAMDKWM
jgi:hypothetical protein